MKKALKILSIVPLLGMFFLLNACNIQNPQPDDCEIKEIPVFQIYEGGAMDIVFAEDNRDFYYINRGLEQGLTIADLKQKVLNKKVTLHLAKTLMGTSEHISQLAMESEIIYTEFSTTESGSTATNN